MSAAPVEPQPIISDSTRTGACVIVCGPTHVGTTTWIRKLLLEQGQL